MPHRRPLALLLSCATALAAFLAGSHAMAAAPSADPPAFQERSHQALAQRVNSAQAAEYGRVLAEFDAYLKRRPADSVAAVERCRFIDVFADAEESTIESAGDDSAQCHQSLAKGRLAATPAVRLFVWQQDFGKAGIAQGEAMLAEPGVWSAAQRAEINESLAARYRDDPLKSGAHALSAVELDPASSQRLAAAEYLVRIGAGQRAIAMIEGMPAGGWQTWTLHSAVITLTGMGEAGAALRLMQAHADIKLDPTTRIKLARALFDKGDDAGARTLMKALLEEPLSKTSFGHALERELFEFQRDHGERGDAIAAYRKLRDRGYEADPYGRYRLSLSLRYPGAPWRLPDLLGIAALLLPFGFLVLLPLLIVVPLHYRSAVKRARGAPPPLPSIASPWGLGQLWYALAVMLVGGGLVLYVFCYPQFEGLLRSSPAQKTLPDARALAQAFLWSEAICALALTPLLRHTEPLRLLKGEWSVGKSLGAGFGVSLLVLIAAGILTKLTKAGAAAPGISLGNDTIRAMQGVYTLYGASGLLLSAALFTPIVEEFVFRGVLLRVATRHLPFWVAALMQGLLFTALHDQPGVYPAIFLLAMCAAWLAWRSGGLLAPIAMHVTNNTFAALAVMGLTRSLNAAP